VLAAVMLREAVAVWLREPLAPVTVTVKLPGATPTVVLIVSVVEPEPLTVVGVKVGVAPAGRPDTPKLTVPLKPFVALVVTVYETLLPAVTVAEAGETPTEKSGGGDVIVTFQVPAAGVHGVVWLA
jgi:hypothetical protein